MGENLFDGLGRVQRKAWELLARTDAEGDTPASAMALCEVRECLETLGDLLERADQDSNAIEVRVIHVGGAWAKCPKAGEVLCLEQMGDDTRPAAGSQRSK